MNLQELDLQHAEAYLSLFEEGRNRDLEALTRFSSESLKIKSESDFKKFVAARQKLKMDWRPKVNKISLTDYVMLGDDGSLLACGLMQFPLTAQAESDGGNLICYVPPSKRRQGHGSYCLALLLFEAVRAGLRRVFITAPEADLIARRMIERNRGQLQDVVPSLDPDRKGQPIARYWIQFG